MGTCQSTHAVRTDVNTTVPQRNHVPRRKSSVSKPTTENCSGSTDTEKTHDASMPDDGSTSGLSHGSSRSLRNNSNSGLRGVGSAVGLDKMIEDRREAGTIKSNVVRIEVPFGKPIEEVYDGVHTGPVLGSGISGLVRLVTHRATGIKYAVKCLDLGLVDSEEGLQQLREEIYIMCQLDHPNIVRLEEVYESHNEIYLVQELCLGGELFDRLDEQPDYHYTEQQCARLIKQMLCSVRYIHSKGIVHRDLKLENFLFSTRDADSELKMIDFGLSKHFTFGEVQHEAVGTPYTVAPEVIRGKYDERCDVWAIGVITYLLLSGDPPFGGCGGPESLTIVRNNILLGKFKFEPDDIWGSVSNEAKNFIRSLLITDPLRRLTVQEAQGSVWLKELNEQEETRTLNPNVIRALVAFKEYSDMRKLLCEVLSFTLIPDQIQDLRKEFEKMDSDGSGEISLSALKKVLIDSAGSGSLGGLNEKEVEDIFNAMRVRKSDTTIQWHEFIAAGLSQCKVDDRNLRLAFDRLDTDHKGYITVDDVMDLMGSCGVENGKDAIKQMFDDSLVSCKASQAHIYYDDFLLLMKGQTRESVTGAPPKKLHQIVEDVVEDDYGFMDEAIDIDDDDGPLTMDDDDVPTSIGTEETHVFVSLPEHKHNNDLIESIIKDQNQTPLVVNRCLYRSHRNMRVAVVEASKRFEELQVEKAKESMQKDDGKGSAGLVLRHGASKDNSDVEIFLHKMKENREDQQRKLEKANRQAGRRRNRTKVVSDLHGMMLPTSLDSPAPLDNPLDNTLSVMREEEQPCTSSLHVSNSDSDLNANFHISNSDGDMPRIGSGSVLQQSTE